ncbi:unnamed protein product [Chondrus crispus]|uniref:Uncharacterized protein n=1 Tax=Chondrus crispus TaxID=2769 RepID=R7QEM8_CHOCR|nr:unnamed protein product [Chondrus crispus]CDF35911.1 unnamed protein product [Chondrus crispus]|eukprot:XP_005715730.1 unnamed protein product [Chondrus crispus]
MDSSTVQLLYGANGSVVRFAVNAPHTSTKMVACKAVQNLLLPCFSTSATASDARCTAYFPQTCKYLQYSTGTALHHQLFRGDFFIVIFPLFNVVKGSAPWPGDRWGGCAQYM